MIKQGDTVRIKGSKQFGKVILIEDKFGDIRNIGQKVTYITVQIENGFPLIFHPDELKLETKT